MEKENERALLDAQLNQDDNFSGPCDQGTANGQVQWMKLER
jgi:hypothetical protein